jgi:hypothetical protein
MADHIDQAGSYNTEFYHLPSPPNILIFYSASTEQNKDSVQMFFTDRHFTCTAEINPTGDQILNSITAVHNKANFSGLIVFILTPAISLKDIMSHMAPADQHSKPQVFIIQPSVIFSLLYSELFISDYLKTSVVFFMFSYKQCLSRCLSVCLSVCLSAGPTLVSDYV